VDQYTACALNLNIPTMKIRINTIYALLITSVLFTLLSAAITYDNIREKEEATGIIVHSYKAIQASSQLLALLTDMETGQRGYCLTGDAYFLQIYEDGLMDYRRELGRMRDLAPQRIEDRRLEETIILASETERFYLDSLVHRGPMRGHNTAALRQASLLGKEKIDHLRQLVSQLTLLERSMQEEQNVVLHENKKLDPLRFAAFGLIGLTCIAAFVTITRKERANGLLLLRLKDTNVALERKVRQRTRQLTEANAAKDHFLGVATHDLKAPLNGVIGLVNIMRSEKSLSVAYREYLDLIERSCTKMKHLIADLLDISQLDQGARPLRRQTLAVLPMLTRMQREYQEQAARKGILLVMDAADIQFEADPDVLSRILENLLSNALKFSGAGTQVRVTACADERGVRFDVVDEGPGIAAEELPKLFKKFQRLSNRPTQHESSTGLGLFIVKELVELHGGEIRVESRLGVGSVFTVVLPR
jgi:signal transduction histidine kinase